MKYQLLPVIALVGLSAFGALACSALTAGCTDDLSARVAPSASTLGVGQRVRATAEFRGCHGSRVLADRITWASDAPAVARVDSLTGEITGISVGTARVQPRGDRYGVAPAGIAVEVR